MEKLAHNNIIEKSSLYLDLSESLLEKIDLFLCNVNLTNNQKESVIKLCEEVYSESYVNSLID